MQQRWKQSCGLALLLAVVLLLAGCSSASRHLSRGDDALEAGDMRSALHHYERALAARDSLADDDDFRAKLATTQSRVAYEDAVALRRQGHFEAAARKLKESLTYDENFEPAAQLLAQVNQEVARHRYDQAITSADRGSLAAAEDHLRIAQAHDTANEEVVAALASLRVEVLPANTPGLAEYQSGLSLAAQRRWDVASGAYRSSIGLNRNMLPARASLAESELRLVESRQQSDRGAARIRESRISAAIPLLERSLAIWPFNEPAQASLTQARAVLAQADEKFAQSVAAGEASDWDTAIAAADAGLVLDRAHARLRELRPNLATRAATDYIARGSVHVDANELEAARDAYLRALSYKHPHSPAQRGLAGVYHTWGRAHEQASRPGAALLNYKRGQTFMATSDIAQGLARTRSAIYDGLAMTLAVDVADTPGGLAVSADRLGGALLSSADRTAPTGFALDDQQPRFVLETQVTDTRISRQRVAATTRNHCYRVNEQRPNPEYARQADRLRRLQVDVDRLERDYHSHVGNNHGHHHHDPHTPENNHLNHLLRQLEQKQHAVSQQSRRLHNTPREITVAIEHNYPYTVETYTKTGVLTIESRLIDTVTGEVIETFTDEASALHRDTTILNPRPSIGLRANTLNLPDDATVASELAHGAARHATARAIESAVMYELDAIRALGAAQREAGEFEAALETEVAAALLVSMVDDNASARVLDTLGEAHVE